MSTQETKPIQDEELSAYLINVAKKLQSKLDEVGGNMEKKLDEMSKRIDTLERNLKQLEKDSNKPQDE